MNALIMAAFAGLVLLLYRRTRDFFAENVERRAQRVAS
jgi:hypothetical protein